MNSFYSQVGVGTLKSLSNDEVLAWKRILWEDLLTPNFLGTYNKVKAIIITETERLQAENDDTQLAVDFRILQPPTVEPFTKHISEPAIRVFLPYVGIIKAGKDGKIVTVGNIPEKN